MKDFTSKDYKSKKENHIRAYNKYRNKQDEKIAELKQRVYQLERTLDFLIAELMERLL